MQISIYILVQGMVVFVSRLNNVLLDADSVKVIIRALIRNDIFLERSDYGTDISQAVGR